MRFKKRSDEADVSAKGSPEEENPQKNSRKMEINVIIYTLVLFVAALGLILLSYAIQQRDASLQPEDAALSAVLDGEAAGDYIFSVENNLTENGGAQP